MRTISSASASLRLLRLFAATSSGLLAWSSALRADLVFTQAFTVNAAIPDLGEFADSRTVSFGASVINFARVRLKIENLSVTTPAASGDYYAGLGHDTAYAVLLNRIGRTDTDPFGSGHGGIDVTFADDALAGDIHLAPFDPAPLSSPALTGTWAPDGRTADPSVVTAASPRTATLAGFAGRPVDGAWELLVNDEITAGAGAAGRLVSWTVVLDVTPDSGAVLQLADTSTSLTFTTSQTLTNDLHNGGHVFGPSSPDGPVTFTGAITGAGSFTGDFVFAGTYAPGPASAPIAFTGNTLFTSSHILTLAISSTGYESLSVAGTLSLGGTLNIVFANGFVPSPTEPFRFFTASSIAGSFTQVNLPPGYLAIGDLASGDEVTFGAIPEPAACALFAALATLALAPRRRRA